MTSVRARGTVPMQNRRSTTKLIASFALVLTVSASPFARALTPEAAAVYAQFLGELKLRATAAAAECGGVDDDASSDAMLTCADRALARHQPFWFARRLQGVDSALWMGVASDGRGPLYRIFFDSDVKGGGEPPPRPSLDAYRCSDKKLRARNWPPFLDKGCRGIDVAAPRVPVAP